jgi:hypothetical protein
MRTASLLGSVLVTALATSSAHACDIGRWQPHITEASRRYGIAEDWIRAVMRAESAGCTHLDGRPITSSTGAMGLMQLMPATWAELRQRHGFGADPHEPRDNILAGVAYLRELADRFGVPGAFAAYHAGPNRYESHLRHGAALPVETRRYLAQVSAAASEGNADHMAEQATGPDSLFAVVRNRGAADARELHSPDPRLFVPLQHARSADAETSSASLEQTRAEP